MKRWLKTKVWQKSVHAGRQGRKIWLRREGGREEGKQFWKLYENETGTEYSWEECFKRITGGKMKNCDKEVILEKWQT